MNRTAIYSKTGKGVQEATGKTSNLSRADRAVLSAIDGKTNVAALYKKFEKTPEPRFHQLLERLDREGYIREASPGVVTQPSSRPAAPPAAKPMDAVSDLDFTGVFAPVKSSPPSVPKPPPIDFAAKARAGAERRAQEESLGYKARQAAEAKAKAEAEARAREASSASSKAETDSRIRAEAEQKLKAAQEMALRIAAEEKAKAEKARAEAEAKAKAEEEQRKRKEEEERKRKEDEARKRKEEEERRRREEEEARKRKEEEEARKRKEEEERKRKEEEERRRREEEEARKRKEEEEARKRKEEEEARKRKEEEERKRKEEEERKRKEEDARKRKEEEERKRREEEEARKRKEEEEARKRKEEEERKRREEEEARRLKEEEQARRRREEEEGRRRKEEEDRRRREEEEARRRREEEEAQRRKEEEEAAAAPAGDSFADSLLADLDSFSQRGEKERKAHDESERKAHEESERRAREAAERKVKEQAERDAREKREEEGRRQRAEEAEARKAPESTSEGRARRRLAAIVAADIAGYSRLMGIDEEGTLTRFKRMMREIIQPKVDEHSGRIVKTAGDGLLIEFPSVVDAVRFAVQVQTSVANEEADVAQSRQIAFRMGVNLGDIIGEDNDVYGDGVNVAARLEALADKGGICIAGVVFDQIRDKVAYTIEALGEQKLKNIHRPVRAYKIKGDWQTTKLRRAVEPGSLPHPAVRDLAPTADDEVVVSDEDLDLDEVRRDQQVLTKESRKAERTRVREARKQQKKKQQIEKPIKIRRPRKWGKPVAITLVLALVAAVGAVQVMPVPTAEYAQAASAALGRPVVIRAAHYSVLSGLELQFEGVNIGKIRIATARAFPELSSLLGDRRAFRRIELVGAVVPQAELGNLLLGGLKIGGFSVTRVVAKQLLLTGPVALPQLDVDALLTRRGSVASVSLSGRDKLKMKLVPRDGRVTFEGTAGAFSPPFAPGVSLTDFAFKGSATRDEMTLNEWDGALLEGTLTGTARIAWGRSWSVDGALKFKNVNAAVFAPALLSEGVAAGSGSFAMQGAVPARLGADARIQGSFTVGKGVLGSFDLSRAIQTSGKEVAGRTQFAELTGKGVYDRGAVALRDVNVAAGALNAGAIVDIAPGGKLSGRIVADVKTAGHVLRSTINLAGTVKQPEVKK